jgi:hypothetical protein
MRSREMDRPETLRSINLGSEPNNIIGDAASRPFNSRGAGPSAAGGAKLTEVAYRLKLGVM